MNEGSVTMRKQVATGILFAIVTAFAAAGAQQANAQTVKHVANAVAGVWDLKGVDASGTKWIATVVLTQKENNRLAGHIDWLSSKGACGREYVSGAYDSKLRVLKITGNKVEFANNVVRASYRARLSRNGLQLEDGRWSDNDPTIPGTWYAKRVRIH